MPYLSRRQIEREATDLLASYFKQNHWPFAPIPIDEIAELHLGLSIDFLDLRQMFGVGDVHGALWLHDRLIGVDRRFDPVQHSRAAGRYCFTVAHEVGHWQLHRHCLLDRDLAVNTPDSHTYEVPQACRFSDGRARIEWQADYFAACLLMPRMLVLAAWREWRGNTRPITSQEMISRPLWEVAQLLLRNGAWPRRSEAATQWVLERMIRPLAGRLGVSAPALRIRLTDLGLLPITE